MAEDSTQNLYATKERKRNCCLLVLLFVWASICIIFNSELHFIDGISDRWQLVIAMGKLVEVVVWFFDTTLRLKLTIAYCSFFSPGAYDVQQIVTKCSLQQILFWLSHSQQSFKLSVESDINSIYMHKLRTHNSRFLLTILEIIRTHFFQFISAKICKEWLRQT